MAFLYLKYVETGMPSLFHGILCLVAFLFWTIFAILVVPFMAMFRCMKVLETKLISYRKLGTVFSTLDVPFLHESKSNRNFIIGMMEVSGEPNITKIRKLVYNRVIKNRKGVHKTYERLTQRVTRRYWSYIWKDEENFSIKQHIPFYKGPLPVTKNDLEKLYCKFAADLFPSNISPWKLYVIPKQNKEGFVMFLKIHHVIGDGFALIGLISQLMDRKPEFIKPSTVRKGFTSNPVKRLVWAILTGPLVLLCLSFSFKIRDPFSTKEVSKKKTVAWTEQLCLKLVKRIKSVTGTTVNDVLLSCLAGSIRKYLIEKGVHIRDLPIAMPYNLRSLSELTDAKIPLGNQSGGLLLNLPVSVSDPLKRLEKTKIRMNKLKELSHGHVFSFIYCKIIGFLPEFIGRFSTFSLKRHVSLICSNVPGPVDELTMFGHSVESAIFTPPLHADIGLAVSIFSYKNQIKVAMLCDAEIIPDPNEITKQFEQELLLLGEKTMIDD